MSKPVPHCDCPESSEALGLYVSKYIWRKDVHKMTQTEIIRENNCKYCGNFVFWNKVKGESNENNRNQRN